MKILSIFAVGGVIISAAVGVIILGTLALFSDTVTTTHHLVAGTLDIRLERTKSVRYELDETTGFLVSVEDNEKIDFSNPTTENIFGLKDETVLVPGMSFESTLEISNAGNVAFGYFLAFKLNEASEAMKEQILISVSIDDVLKYEGNLKEDLTIGSENDFLEIITLNNLVSKLVVKFEFLDLEDNNEAMMQEMNFDMVVHAIQKTTEA